MDVIENSCKRNHRSPPPSSTFTHSRTQLPLHRNRSGQIRFDPVPKKDKPHSGSRSDSRETLFCSCSF
ncbi:hypothetical protein P8452_70254 [Trifolium repens]|nr:hypothetical protein P8452_70254 [Trifolium repens]